VSVELLAVAGLDQTSEAFRVALVNLAVRLGLNPSYLAAVMSFETGATFSPSERNDESGATGLIQITPENAERLGTTADELAEMTAEQQLPYVESFLSRVLGGRKIRTLSDHYLAVFAPAHIGAEPNQVLYQAPSDSYAQNAGLDTDGDGTIRVWEAAGPVARIVERAEGLPPIIVPAAPEGSSAVTAIGSAVLFGLMVWGIAKWFVNIYKGAG
jgi:hypothetical protein